MARAKAKRKPTEVTGIEPGDGGMWITEDLSDDDRAAAGLELAIKQQELAKLESDWKETKHEHGKAKKDIGERIAVLAHEVTSATRKKPAQQTLRGFDGGGEVAN